MRRQTGTAQHCLSPELLARVRTKALQQVELIDQLEAALAANDTPRVMSVAREICGIEQEIKDLPAA